MKAGNRVTMSWPEAVGQIAGQRTRAETYVGLLKKYGDDAQIARGQLTYADLKADFDAVIAGLIAALSTGQPPESPFEPASKIDERCIWSGRIRRND